MLFFRPEDFLSGDEDIAHCQLTALGIPKDDPDTNRPLTLEQRVKLLEMELAATKKGGIDPLQPTDKGD
jgi:hypothetical protein